MKLGPTLSGSVVDDEDDDTDEELRTRRRWLPLSCVFFKSRFFFKNSGDVLKSHKLTVNNSDLARCKNNVPAAPRRQVKYR